ncbi:MAG: transporter [Rickettsiales bacterium]|jgi:outer membrane protein assembly factor BamD|nr:transporter [Rickettsiales bacterium]
MFQRVSALLILGTMFLLVTACSSKKDDVQPVDSDLTPLEQADSKANDLYMEAMDLLQKRSYKKAIEKFEEIERLYPYAKWATKSQLMTAYAQYKDEEYDDAVSTLDRFIQLHPGSADTDYAYYLKAQCYYERIRDVGRDQDITAKARTALEELIARFPDSSYARDARMKLDLVRDHLAGKEMEVGRFYLKDGKTIAAINRFRAVVDQYQTTSHAAEALYRLVEAYLTMGVVDEAQKYAAVLGYNYPDSKWYRYAYDLFKDKGVTPPENSALREKDDSETPASEGKNSATAREVLIGKGKADKPADSGE